MVAIPEFRLEFDAKAGAQAVDENLKATAKEAAIEIGTLLILGADAEKANTIKRGTAQATDTAQTLAGYEQQKQLCAAALESLIQLAQTGELDLTQLQNTLKNQILQSIKDNNAKADTLNEQMTILADENKELKSQIETLAAEEGIEFEALLNASLQTESSEENQSSENENISSDGSTSKKTRRTRSKKTKGKVSKEPSDKLQELLDKYNKNTGIISALQTTHTDIIGQQAQLVAEGESIQAQTEAKHTEVSENLQSKGRNLFQQISDGIRNLFGKGKAKQVAHQATTTAYATADTAAAAAKTAEATGEGIASVATVGLTSALAAEATRQATVFTNAALKNTSIAGLSVADISALATGEQTIGTLIAEKITNKVNEQIPGGITTIANEVLGEEIAQYVAPELSNALKIDLNEPQQA